MCGVMTATRVSLSFCCIPVRILSSAGYVSIAGKNLEALTLHNCGSKPEKF